MSARLTAADRVEIGALACHADLTRTTYTSSATRNRAYTSDSGTSSGRSGFKDRRRELFGAVADLPRPDLIAWLRGYIRRHPEPHNPRTREALRWLASLERDSLISPKQWARLLANGRATFEASGAEEPDHEPVVWLTARKNGFTDAVWLLTEIVHDPGGDFSGLSPLLYGLCCDLGSDSPELGFVFLSELEREDARQDWAWTARGPLSAYVDAADGAGRIVDLLEGGE